MVKYYSALLLFALFFCIVLGTSAQRHGRADSIQNYRRAMIAAPAEFILHLGADQKKLCFTAARLGHMTRSTVTITDHTTKRVRTFEGVDISSLILEKGPHMAVLEVSLGSFRKKRIPVTTLDEGSKVMVADTVDRAFSGSAPFRLLLEMDDGHTQLFNHATRVAIRSSL